MAESNWHYAQNDQTFGPVSFAALRDLAARRVVQPGTLIWSDGMTEWAPAETMPALWSDAPQAVAGLLAYQTALVPDFYYAGFCLRFVAFLIDWVIILILALICGGIAGVIFGVAMAARHGNHSAAATSVRVAGQLLSAIVSWLYYALMESSPQQATLGKMALGLRVTDLNGSRLSFGRASGRFFGRYL